MVNKKWGRMLSLLCHSINSKVSELCWFCKNIRVTIRQRVFSISEEFALGLIGIIPFYSFTFFINQIHFTFHYFISLINFSLWILGSHKKPFLSLLPNKALICNKTLKGRYIKRIQSNSLTNLGEIKIELSKFIRIQLSHTTISDLYYVSSLFPLCIPTYEAQKRTLLGLGVSIQDTDACNYTELCNFLKLLACRCVRSVSCSYPCFKTKKLF